MTSASPMILGAGAVAPPSVHRRRARCTVSGSERTRISTALLPRGIPRGIIAVRARKNGFGDMFDGMTSRDDDAVLDADALPPTCALPLNIDTGDVPYSEASRPYRRTVFTNADWLQHRSSTRLFGNLAGTFTSGVVRSLLTEVGAVATIGAAACLWNGSIQGFEDFANVTADPLTAGYTRGVPREATRAAVHAGVPGARPAPSVPHERVVRQVGGVQGGVGTDSVALPQRHAAIGALDEHGAFLFISV